MKKCKTIISMFFIVFASTMSWAVVREPVMENDGILRFAGHGADELRYAPGEIIVKYKEDAAGIVEKELKQRKAIKDLKITKLLDKLNKKYKVTEIRQLFPNFKANQAKVKNLLTKDIKQLTKREQRLVRRQKRAPKGMKVPALERIYKIQLGKEQSEIEALIEYRNNENIEYAELNYVVNICASPNDPCYSLQWALNNIGQDYPIKGGNTASGTPDCDIDANDAWDINTGEDSIIVAVIDTGVDYNHRDLQNNMWINEDEKIGDGNGDGRPGVANVDDDGDGLIDEDSNDLEPGDPNYINDLMNDDDENGYIDDIYGYDFCTIGGKSRDSDPIDDHGHGTHCSGIIAADSNNGLDIAGVSWHAKIMAIKFISSEGYGYGCDAIDSIKYAVENGADITSNSWGGGGYSEALEDMVNYATSQGVIMIAAAGNNYDDDPVYPAFYDNMFSVSATDSNDVKASFSTYGNWIDVAAPGVDILSLHAAGTDMYGDADHYYPNGDPNATMYIASGTSMACPHVAGLAALCLAEEPNLLVNDFKVIIKYSADDIGDPNDPNDDTYYGSGRINVYNTINNTTDFPEPNKATNPYPPNNEQYVSINVHLSWSPDELASSHDVYLGTDFNDVNDANTSSDEFMGNLIQPIYEVNTLDPNTTYYWRIDERNYAGFIKGDVWSFTSRNGDIIYVDINADGNDNGTSWEDAYNSLEDALSVAFADNVWVAEGTYIPDTNDRSVSFCPHKGTKLYGGFAGTENSIDDRDSDLSANETILCGDIGTVGDINDNCYHVVVGNDNITLDRFTITKGYADDETLPTPEGGGGLYNWFVSDVKVNECNFIDNYAYIGGGIYNYNSTSDVNNCIFIENIACYAGAIVDWTDSQLVLVNSLFIRNTAIETSISHGGALVLSKDYPTIINCTFSENQAIEKGGAVVSFVRESFDIKNCIFWNNAANNNPEICVCTDYQPILSFCDIKNCYDSNNVWDPNLGIDGGGNIDEDPLFVDPNNDDYHIDVNSPCINKGDPNGDYSGQTDIDGQIRVIDDCNEIVDMGADEVYYHNCWNCPTQCHGDADCDGYVGDDDALILTDAWYDYNPCADFNRDELINANDVTAYFLPNYETYPDPNCECGGTWPPE